MGDSGNGNEDNEYGPYFEGIENDKELIEIYSNSKFFEDVEMQSKPQVYASKFIGEFGRRIAQKRSKKLKQIRLKYGLDKE